MTADPNQLHMDLPDLSADGIYMELYCDDLPTEILAPTPSDSFVKNVCQAQLQPIIVQSQTEDMEKGPFTLISGRRRLVARRLGGMETIAAIVYTKDQSIPQDLFALAENHHRADNPYSDYDAVHKLKTAGRTDEEIAYALDVPVSAVLKKLKIGNLHVDLLRAALSGFMRVGAAEKAASLPTDVQERLLPLLKEEGREFITREDVLRVAKEARGSTDAPALLTGEDLGEKTWIQRARDGYIQIAHSLPQAAFTLDATLATEFGNTLGELERILKRFEALETEIHARAGATDGA